MMLLHIFSSLAGQISALFWIFIFFFLVDRLLRIEELVDRRGLFLNCAAGFFYLFVKNLTFLVAASLLLRVPHGRISAFPVS
jgi:hypothetical protein